MATGAFEIIDVDMAGRIGRLRLKGGTLETPAFFPVIDPIRQEVPLEDIRSAGFNQIITNAYLLYKRFGPSPGKDVRELLGWKDIVMTDSGAYQILEYGSVDIDQDTVLKYQRDVLKSDIGVILDVPTGDVERPEAEASVRETLRRAREALRVIDPANDDILWVLPVQGGRYLDLVSRSAEWAARSPYRMYGLGSPTVFMENYRYDIIIDMILAAKRRLPPGKPLHLFGAGHPLILPFAVALGVDTFDSASYILYARDDRYMAEYGVYRLDELEYFPCNCPVCSKYTPEELREMPRRERVRLLALHNLYVISTTIKRIKQAIREGRLWELLEETARKHPSAHAALMRLRRGIGFIVQHSPRAKPRVKGLRLYSRESLWNPKLLLYRERLYSRFLEGLLRDLAERRGLKTIMVKPLPRDAGDCRPSPRDKRVEGAYIVYYKPYIGLIPEDLCGVYPTIHSDYSHVSWESLKELASEVAVLVARARRYGLQVRVEVAPATARLCELLKGRAGSHLEVGCR